MMLKITKLVTLLFMFVLIYNSIIFAESILSKNTSQSIKMDLYFFNNTAYVDVYEFTNSHNFYIKHYETKDKFEITIKNSKIYFSPSTSFCKINNQIYNLTYPVLQKNNSIYIPAFEFYEILKSANLALRIIEFNKSSLYVSPNIFNISDLLISNRKNGTLLILKTEKQFTKKEISSSISSSKWLNITLLNGMIDSVQISNIAVRFPVKKVRTIQSKESAQLSILLDSDIEDVDIDIQNQEIHFLLRNAIIENAQKITEMKQKWFIDTIILDAGHGGKDPGALGYNNLQEKDVTLPIALKLGQLIKDNLGLKVVYTRTTDVFVPLWKRTKIANESKGKLFISIHANAAQSSPHTRGFETYLLRPGKTGQAIDVAKRENAVIELEQMPQNYKDINEHFIIAAMAQNSFMKESEDFAALIQKNMSKNLNTSSKNRGVKQAGFHVLVGASMPNVLIEIGFLTNKNEAKNLAKKSYQNKIADAIYKAIVDFKVKYEKPLINE